MYKMPSKQSQLLKRIVTYGLMTVSVLLLVVFLVFIMLGYRFNRDTSTIQQGGLVQFASRPIDANVTIGKAKLSDLTPSKITVNPGTYDVSMTRDGYKPWSKNVSVRSGEVLWLNYTQLVPETIETKQLTKFATIAGVKSSPNGDRFAVLQDASKPIITFVDVTGDTPKQTSVTIPSEALRSSATPTYSLGDWANDSDRLLVNATYGSEVERLVVDRRDETDTRNISKEYEADIAEILFDPRSSERLITRSAGGDVRTINTSDDTSSKILATLVTSMSVYGSDALLLVQAKEAGKQNISYISLGSDTVKTLRTVTSAERVHAAAVRYFSEPHLGVSTGSRLEVFKLATLPSSESEDSISMSNVHTSILPGVPEYLSARSGRFMFAQYAGGVATYDIEIGKQTLTTFNAPVSGEIRWLDRYHFYISNGTNLEVMEFDGGNPRIITPLTTQFDVVQSDNGTFVYSVNAVDGGFAIQQSRMILK